MDTSLEIRTILRYHLDMIASIKGIVLDKGDRYAIIDVSGIGYKVFVTEDTLHSIERGTETFLFTHLAVREDAMDLYGFISNKELRFFESLISVSGIGPKSALNILSLAPVETLASAIRTGSTTHLVKVSGIGRKTAEKIVMELKEKLGTISHEESSGKLSADMASDMDAIEALRALGYSTDEAREALKKVSSEISENYQTLDTGSKVKAVLKILK